MAGTVALFIISYLIGVFPTGVLVARIRGIDLTKTGSGSVGATNVTRALGPKAGAFTLVVDALKGTLAVWLAPKISPLENADLIGAIFVVVGHCYSIPYLLRGGKGVATSLGTLVMLTPIGAVVSLVVYALIFAITKVSSISSLSAVASVLIVAGLTANTNTLLALGVIAGIITSRHRENIRRLIRREEPPVG